MKNRVVILSCPIRSGKTTALQEFCKKHDVAGWVTPDVNGRRVMIDLTTSEQIAMVVDEHEGSIQIGRFHFSQLAFDKGMEIVDAAIKGKSSWFIIDEIGHLELNDEGFNEALLLALDQLKTNLLLVVRDTLLQQVQDKYKLHNANVVIKDWLFLEY